MEVALDYVWVEVEDSTTFHNTYMSVHSELLSLKNSIGSNQLKY